MDPRTIDAAHADAAKLDARIPDWSIFFGEHSKQFTAVGRTGLVYAKTPAELAHKLGITQAAPGRGGEGRPPVAPYHSPNPALPGAFTLQAAPGQFRERRNQ
jgi:hypothetical protein